MLNYNVNASDKYAARLGQDLLNAAGNPDEKSVDGILSKLKGKDGTFLRTVLTAKNKYDETSLHCAASSGNAEVFQVILVVAENAGLTQELLKNTNKFGQTPLHLAARYCNADVVQAILTVATTKDLTRKLLEAKDREGQTPLHLAAAYGM